MHIANLSVVDALSSLRSAEDGLSVAEAEKRLDDTRANLLSSEKLITGDKYTFIRNAYLQNREFKVKDGEVKDDF